MTLAILAGVEGQTIVNAKGVEQLENGISLEEDKQLICNACEYLSEGEYENRIDLFAGQMHTDLTNMEAYEETEFYRDGLRVDNYIIGTFQGERKILDIYEKASPIISEVMEQ